MLRIPKRSFNVRLEEDVSVDWQRGRCGKQQTATLTPAGAGHAIAMTRSQAEEHASERAREDLLENAQLVARAAACPACGASDPSGLEELAAANRRQTVTLLLAGLVICVIAASRDPSMMWTFLLLAAAVFASASYRATTLERLREAVARVRFTEPKSQPAASSPSTRARSRSSSTPSCRAWSRGPTSVRCGWAR